MAPLYRIPMLRTAATRRAPMGLGDLPTRDTTTENKD
ncbi:hypothetical protein ROJ8625_02077 [Roseivivax jejudonensis]|uniref:Uncharacterized protein n=1 Tax=Roseivivax jejudonensis TaxID=1529041 RepID=A0A1X6Z6V2_9RHOB|nr:hypothetical protein ROJ8625_02077 [Roseivivax jejudonensis]